VTEDDLVRFPGAVVDFDFLDAFEWSPELLAEYAERAHRHAVRYGSRSPRGQLPSAPPGRCQDCRKPAQVRVRFGPLALCERCAGARLRVRRELGEASTAAGGAAK
jgi:hypothetical protein